MASSFSIQAAAERTGLTPHVIRAWERRYRAIEPERSAGKHRLYSEGEIERLAMLHRAVRSGHSIGKIASLPTGELRAMMAHQPAISQTEKTHAPGESAPRFLKELLASVMRFDGPVLEDTLRRAQVTLATWDCSDWSSRRSRRKSANVGARAISPRRTSIFSPRA